MPSFLPVVQIHRDALVQRGDAHLPGRILPGDIREIRPSRFPPEVVLHDGRILFVPRPVQRALVLFGRLHGLPFVDRNATWSLLCEPFLDTEHDASWMAAVDARLGEDGFAPDEIRDLRERVGPDLLAYNSLVWEWVDLGHPDVLAAHAFRWTRAGAVARHVASAVAGQAETPPWSAGDFRRWTEEISHRARELARYDRPPEEPREEMVQRIRWRFERARSALLPPEILRQVDDALEAVVAAWAGPGRSYHGPGHLLAMLDALQGHEPRYAFGLAAFFHDAVLDPTRADNEVRSAAWLDEALAPAVAAGAVPAATVDLARRMILATATPFHRPADAPAVRRFLDADFQVFASHPDDHDRAVDGIREEYAAFGDDAFEAGRRAFLDRLAREVEVRGFFFEFAEPVEEAVARENLARERNRRTS